MDSPVAIGGKTIEDREKEFFEFKTQQKAMLERKAGIQKKIESLRREFDFIKNLDTKDVTYVLAQKQDHFARIIQRSVRRFLARKRQRDLKKGINLVEEERFVETADDVKRREANKKFYDDTSNYVFARQKKALEAYKEKISDSRKHELLKEVIDRRNAESDYYVRTLNCEEVRKAF